MGNEWIYHRDNQKKVTGRIHVKNGSFFLFQEISIAQLGDLLSIGVFFKIFSTIQL